MANWTTLKEALISVIKTNGNQEITGQLLQNTLLDIINSVGKHYQFIGLAVPATIPQVEDGYAFYIASNSGAYPNFGITIPKNGLYIIKNNNQNTWEVLDVSVLAYKDQDCYNLLYYKPLPQGQFYTHETAIANVPYDLVKPGLSIKYLLANGTFVHEQFISTDINAFGSPESWKILATLDNVEALRLSLIQLLNQEVEEINQTTSALEASIEFLDDDKMEKNGSNSNVDSLKFNATSNPALTQIGEMKYNPDTKSWSGKTSANTEYDFGLEVIKHVKNDQGTTILNGKVVYVSGGQGKNVLVKLATNTDQEMYQKAFAVATQDISTFGFVCTYGAVRGIDTSAFLEGDRLYLGTNGSITKVEPVAPTPKVFIGTCTYSHAINGEIDVQIRPIARLSKLSDVYAPANETGNVLKWNDITKRYENFNVDNKIVQIETDLNANIDQVRAELNAVDSSQSESYVSQNMIINSHNVKNHYEKDALINKLSSGGGYIQKDGTVLVIENSDYWFYDIYDISNFDKIKIVGNGHINTSLFAIYSDNDYSILLAKRTGNGQESILIDKPIGAKYLLCTRNDADGYSSVVYSVNSIEIGVNRNNKLNYVKTIEGYINHGGSIVDVIGAGYNIRIYKIDDYNEINIIGIQPNGTYYGFFADENLTDPKMIFEKGRLNTIEKKINIPFGAVYFACSEYVVGSYNYITKVYGDFLQTNNEIVCLGDSITQGNYAIQQQSWMYYLQQIDKINTYINAGVGGQVTLQIAARSCGIPVYINKSIDLPNDLTKIEIANYNLGLKSTDDDSEVFISDAKYDSGDGKGLYDFGKVNPVYVDGVECALSHVGTINGFNTTSPDFQLFLNRTTTDPNLAETDTIIIPKGSVITTYFGHKLMKSKGLIIWIGTNDAISDFPKLPERIDKIVRVFGSNRYIVIGPWICAQAGSQNTIEELNPTAQSTVETTNNSLRNKFGKNYLDMLNWGKIQAWRELDITLTALDNARISNGYIPSSLTIDGVHPTIEMCQIMAKRIYKKIISI